MNNSLIPTTRNQEMQAHLKKRRALGGESVLAWDGYKS